MPDGIQKVVVHPLVLLSVVDHFNRMGKVGNMSRVVGILLGSVRKGVLDVANSFAVPFDEDPKDSSVWFLDHDYFENMAAMFKKVNAREKIVGWYHTGPKLHPNDILINEMIRRYCPNSVLVIIDAKPKELGLPTDAYYEVEEIHDDGTPTSKTFEHLPSEMGAEEAEEVGVEHLLRDIKDTTTGSLSQKITGQLLGLRGLLTKLQDIARYLDMVYTGKLPVSQQIAYQLQDVLNLLPDVHLQSFVGAVFSRSNDQMLVMYVAAMVRSIIALHNLILNKIDMRNQELGIEPKKTVKKVAGAGDAKDKDSMENPKATADSKSEPAPK